jgi:hypothetical protein
VDVTLHPTHDGAGGDNTATTAPTVHGNHDAGPAHHSPCLDHPVPGVESTSEEPALHDTGLGTPTVPRPLSLSPGLDVGLEPTGGADESNHPPPPLTGDGHSHGLGGLRAGPRPNEYPHGPHVAGNGGPHPDDWDLYDAPALVGAQHPGGGDPGGSLWQDAVPREVDGHWTGPVHPCLVQDASSESCD